MQGDKPTGTDKAQKDGGENEALSTVPPGNLRSWSVSSVSAFVSEVTNRDESGQKFLMNKVNG
ncbi:hypothetical protein ACTXT7_011943 [Hymenolepis weldensis]